MPLPLSPGAATSAAAAPARVRALLDAAADAEAGSCVGDAETLLVQALLVTEEHAARGGLDVAIVPVLVAAGQLHLNHGQADAAEPFLRRGLSVLASYYTRHASGSGAGARDRAGAAATARVLPVGGGTCDGKGKGKGSPGSSPRPSNPAEAAVGRAAATTQGLSPLPHAVMSRLVPGFTYTGAGAPTFGRNATATSAAARDARGPWTGARVLLDPDSDGARQGGAGAAVDSDAVLVRKVQAAAAQHSSVTLRWSTHTHAAQSQQNERQRRRFGGSRDEDCQWQRSHSPVALFAALGRMHQAQGRVHRAALFLTQALEAAAVDPDVGARHAVTASVCEDAALVLREMGHETTAVVLGECRLRLRLRLRWRCQ